METRVALRQDRSVSVSHAVSRPAFPTRTPRQPLLGSHAGFTLVELLVVIAVICILAALMLPVLRKSVNAAYTVKCANNMRQCHMGAMHYAEDYAGWVTSWNNVSDLWYSPLVKGKYIPGDLTGDASTIPRDAIMSCPSISNADTWIGRSFGVVYRKNEFNKYFDRSIWRQPGWGSGWYRLPNIKNASRFVYYADTIWQNSSNEYRQCALFAPTSTIAANSGVDARRHGVTGNFTAADGHTEADNMSKAIERFEMGTGAFYW